jgi:hypothetical protein
MIDSYLHEKQVLQRYEDAYVELLKLTHSRERRDRLYEVATEFHQAWVEFERLTPKIGKFDPRYLALVDRVELRLKGGDR